VIFDEPEHTNVFPGSFPLLLRFQLQATMEKVEALREIQIRQGQRMIERSGFSFQQGQIMDPIEENPFLALLFFTLN